jgi:hypothetical protein
MATGPTAQPPSSRGRGAHAPIDERYVRDYLEAHERRLKSLETNARIPVTQSTADLTDQGLMSQATAGHTAAFDETTGTFMPSPVQAMLTFHKQGLLTASVSPFQYSRYPTNIIGISTALSTAADPNGLLYAIELNGQIIFTLSQVGSLDITSVAPEPIGSYNQGRIRVHIILPGRGNADWVCNVELGSAVAGVQGPLAQNTQGGD